MRKHVHRWLCAQRDLLSPQAMGAVTLAMNALQAAIDEGIPAPVISAALYARFSSRGDDEYADRLLSAMRYEFGGHLEKAKTGEG